MNDRNKIDTFDFIRSIDGELTEMETRRLEEQLLRAPEARQEYQRWKRLSELVRQSATVDLHATEKEHFHSSLNAQLEIIQSKRFTKDQRLTNRLSSFFHIPWQWQTTAAFILVFLLCIPFFNSAPPEKEEFFWTSISSDYKGVQFFLESNATAEYDLIWVVTEEDEEEEEDPDSPLGFLLYKKV